MGLLLHFLRCARLSILPFSEWHCTGKINNSGLSFKSEGMGVSSITLQIPSTFLAPETDNWWFLQRLYQYLSCKVRWHFMNSFFVLNL